MATEYTDNYDLDLYVGEDKPNLRDQYNAAMVKIDAALAYQSEQQASANNAITQIREKDEIQDERLDSQSSELQTHATDIGTLKQTTQSQGQAITSNANAISSLNTRVGTAEGNITNLQTTVNGKAPTNHASSGTSYGVGNATSYGHVRLSDTPSSSGASAGIAATPKMVQEAIASAPLGVTTLINKTMTSAQVKAAATGSGTITGASDGNLVEAYAYGKLVEVSFLNGAGFDVSGGSVIVTLGTLPAEYRPTNRKQVPGLQNASDGPVPYLEVTTNGNIRLHLDEGSSIGNSTLTFLVV